MCGVELFDGERIDSIGFGGLRLIQKPDEFCYGVDAVILAGFAALHAKRTEYIADLCSGNGAVALIMSRKTSGKILAVEMQEKLCNRAHRSIMMNDLEDRIEIMCSDIKDLDEKLASSKDVVVINPPYIEAGKSIESGNPMQDAARRETSAGLDDFLKASHMLLKRHGDLFMIHRPYRLTDILSCARERGIEPKELMMVSPCEGKAPNLVLIHMIKGGGKEMRMLPELHIYNSSGDYTSELLKLYEKI